ncbi:MAG: GNAT family N-acetyltransferase [Bacteroidetes bacterium]|nr:GNAT family N-acetyltransferase [Bacteroidota bacterium]
MIRFEKYSEIFLHKVISIFRSNIPKYFFDFEEKDLIEDLPEINRTFYVMYYNDEIVGAGGYALNDDDTVSLCWGMVHHNYLKQNLGKALLEFRLNEIEKYFPGKIITNVTSQHTTGFFEKYGFEIKYVTENGFGPGLHLCKMELKK